MGRRSFTTCPADTTKRGVLDATGCPWLVISPTPRYLGFVILVAHLPRPDPHITTGKMTEKRALYPGESTGGETVVLSKLISFQMLTLYKEILWHLK